MPEIDACPVAQWLTFSSCGVVRITAMHNWIGERTDWSIANGLAEATPERHADQMDATGELQGACGLNRNVLD